MRKPNPKQINRNQVLSIISIIMMPLVLFIFYRIFTSGNRLISISVIALIAGAVIENKRLTLKWSTVFQTALYSFLLSFLCFLPARHERDYVFEDHIATWPYAFLLFFLMMSVVIHKDKIVPFITESMTLILSIGIVYWVIDHGFFRIDSIFLKVTMLLGLVIAIFSIVNAFIAIKLSKSLRLFLSIWSSIILILLAIDNIYLVYQNGQVEDSVFLFDKIVVGLQYFLLGISSVYILQNVIMVIGFLPSKNKFFNAAYFNDVRELKNEHIQRYSENQSHLLLSFICLFITGGFLFANYRFDLLPRNTAIWLVFFVMNSGIYYYEFMQAIPKPYNNNSIPHK